jgi:hypothetical protein
MGIRMPEQRKAPALRLYVGPELVLNDGGGIGGKTMEIGIHEPNRLVVIVSLLLAVLAVIAQFVGSPMAFWIAMFAYVVGALGVIVKT